MKKSITLFALLTGLFSSLIAQEYQTAVGARLGYPLSVSIKHFIKDSHALEAYVGTTGRFNSRFTNISVAYQIHKSLDDLNLLKGLNWYYGFGASAYFWNWRGSSSFYADRFNSISFGVQGYIGLDYKFEDYPVNISMDWVPSLFINGFGSGFGSGFGAIAVRYTLK